MSDGTSRAPLRSFVDGAWRESTSGTLLEQVNPSDRRDVVARLPTGSAADAAAAAAAAAEAFDAWRALTGGARADHLHRWSMALSERQEEIAQAVTREVGKPIGESRGEVARGVAILRYYAGEAVREIGEVVPAQLAGTLQFTLRVPLGPVALITPWNFPVAIPLWKAAPALAFGNTVVLKPAEASSWTATLLAETAEAARLPRGVFNVLVGGGREVGGPLIEQAEIRAVSFTGSEAVGRHVALAAAGRNIRYQTEMGGKNVAIVLDDADVERAAGLIAAGAMRFAGQKCTATSRVVATAAVEEKLMRELERRIGAMPVGPVTDADALVGPMISATARDAVARTLASYDAEPAIRAALPGDDGYGWGNFMAPVVYRDVAADAELARRELFAPVLAVLRADDLEHALTLANDTPYGLSASLFTRDLAAAMRYIDRIEVGLVRVNGDTTGVDPHAPFGGMKGSSSGTREQGRAAREFYTEVKTVQVSS